MRRDVLRTGAAGALALASGPSVRTARAQATLKQRLGNDLPVARSVNVRLKEAIEAIKKETNDKVEISLFPGNQLGSDNDMMSQVRSGALELATFPGTVMSTIIPVTAVMGIGFAFTGYDKVCAAKSATISARRSIRSTCSRSKQCGTTAFARRGRV
jgi:TRAP-type C4-dicarboxylate transport system substrate-binding protein